MRAPLAFLRELGYSDLEHDSHVPFLAHLSGTRLLLASWGERDALCEAGLFHSVYGTEYFEPKRTPERDEVIAVIGVESERIAWLWCAIRRETIDIQNHCVKLRVSDTTERLSQSEAADLATLWAADTVEQIGRMAPDERAFSNGLLAVVGAASEPAQRAVAELAIS